MTLTYDPVDLTQRLIRVPSITPDNGAALDVVEAHLKPLGFECHRETFQDGGNYPVPNLYARIGTGAPNFCFAGHTDVVPPGDLSTWTLPPFDAMIECGNLYGRGAADMKGAIAAFISAVEMYLSRNKLKGSISFLITGDEEAEALNGTQKALKWITDKGEKLDACLVGEASCAETFGDAIKVGRRGSLGGTLKINGQQGHIAYPHLAKNPIPLLNTIIQTLYARRLDEGDKHFQPSNFEVTSIDTGNPATNVIPAQIEAKFNIRYSPKQTMIDLQQWVEETCKKHAEDFELLWTDKGLPFYTEDGHLRSVVAQAVENITSVKPENSTGGGTSDGRYIHAYCPVVEFGVVNKTIHKVNECVPVEDLIRLKDVYQKTLELFFSER